jgi:hypothetical protein
MSQLQKLAILLMGLFSLAAAAADTDQIYFRAKAGPSFYSNIDPVGTAFGLGLDLGFVSANGFGLSAMANLNFDATAWTSSGTTNIGNHAKTLFVGAGPSYTVTKGIASLTFGLNAGMLSLKRYTYTSASTLSSTSPETTETKFAIAPFVAADFHIAAGLVGTATVQYIATFGDSHPSCVVPLGGIGYRF